MGIDLKEIVVRAAKKGVSLFVELEPYGDIKVTAVRGTFRMTNVISREKFFASFSRQDSLAGLILEEILQKMDEAEEKWIGNGGDTKC